VLPVHVSPDWQAPLPAQHGSPIPPQVSAAVTQWFDKPSPANSP
jgi:hypothetical protein